MAFSKEILIFWNLKCGNILTRFKNLSSRKGENKTKKILMFLILCILIPLPTKAASIDNPKGLAMAYPQYQEDLNTFDIGWWYVWGSAHYDDPRYVPMTWKGENPNLSSDYSGYVLFLNEPDRPDQSNVAPAEAVKIYKDLSSEYPLAKWVVGNTFWVDWLYEFKDICQADIDCIMPTIWGVHAYIGDIQYLSIVTNALKEVHEKLGGTIWITEFADVYGYVVVDELLVEFFKSQSWIERWAYFTNRKGNEPWYPAGWNVHLIDDIGNKTAIGKWYAGEFHKILFPIINKN